jgi:PST family polysaccharide transporter
VRVRPRPTYDPRAYPRELRDRGAAPEPAPEQAPEPAGAVDGIEGAELAKRVTSGVRWSLINTVVMRIGNFATGIVLAHGILGPREWGLYAIGMVALSVLLSANEMGVSLAIVRWEGDVRRFAPTVLTLSTAASTALYLALYATAPHVATLLGSPDATAMLRVLCFAVIIDGIACVPGGVLMRTFAQRQRMVIDFVNFVVSTGLTLGLAVAGYGAMSFAWGAVAGNTAALVGCAIAAPGMLRPGWNRTEARELIRFGLPLAGASLLVLAMLNVDSAVVGATLGPVSLGLYQIAFNISSWPVRTVSEVARRVSFAGFSRVADSPEALSRSFGQALTLLMSVAVPACVLLVTLARPLVRLVYGDQWTAAAGALRFLALLGLLRVAYELAYDCMVACGRRRSLLAIQGWWLVALIPVLIVSAHLHGIAGVGAGHIIVAGPLVAPGFVWALHKAGIHTRVILRACARPFAGGIVMAAVSLGVLRLDLPTDIGLVLSGTFALLAYLPIVWPVKTLLQEGFGRGPAAAASQATDDLGQPPEPAPAPVAHKPYVPPEDDTVALEPFDLRWYG